MLKKDLTSNQYYGGLNKRFDKRINIMRRVKAQYNPNYSGYTSNGSKWNKAMDCRMPAVIMPMNFIMHADTRAFYNELHRLVIVWN